MPSTAAPSTMPSETAPGDLSPAGRDRVTARQTESGRTGQPLESSRGTDVLIVGGSISSLMAACQLKQQMPDLQVQVLGPRPEDEKRPIVGESLVEIAAGFFQRIGLQNYLEQQHLVKYGLSFYHKVALGDPADRRYSVHAPEQLHHLSRQLHRPRFDIDLRRHAELLGVEFLEGKAEEMQLGENGSVHRVQADLGSERVVITARWVIDATGRNRWVGKRVTSYTRPREKQRSAFWFRLADFEPFSDHLKASMRRPLKYDLWYTTHHFMGHGNWVWAIPLQPEGHRNLISVGITYRPDLFEGPIKNVDDLLAYLDREHPAVSQMVRSGTILDTATYHNYLYWADQVYSPDGWFLIGDAARSVDPLYSTGLSMTAVQVEQVSQIIASQRSGGISPEDIQNLESLWRVVADQRQADISDQYASMHEPLAACLRRYWNVCAWFNVLLPLWHNGQLSHPAVAGKLAALFERGRKLSASVRPLIAQVSQSVGSQPDQADFDKTVDFDWLLNPRFDCPLQQVPTHFGRFFRKRAAFRWSLVKIVGLHKAWGQLPLIALERLLAWVMPAILRSIVQAPPASVPKDSPLGPMPQATSAAQREAVGTAP